MNQNNSTTPEEGKEIDKLPAKIRKLYEDSMSDNKELMKMLSNL